MTYNTYMNAVDRADQMRMVNASQRKEKRLYMNIFTYIMDLACVNAFALYKNEISWLKIMIFLSLKESYVKC